MSKQMMIEHTKDWIAAGVAVGAPTVSWMGDFNVWLTTISLTLAIVLAGSRLYINYTRIQEHNHDRNQ